MRSEHAADSAAGRGEGPQQPESGSRAQSQAGLKGGLIKSPLIPGAVACGLFYLALLKVVLPVFPSWQASLEGLFCGHPLAYGTTFLFWVGLAAVGINWLSVPTEQNATRWKPDFKADASSPVVTAERLHVSLGRLPAALAHTLAVERLRGISKFVLGRRSAAGLNSHLEYLAEFAGEQLYNSWSLVRTVTWAVPILGFLGTVIGITHAIENLDPAKLESSFSLVASGLGVAFGTTALSLGLSLVLVFASAFVEKAQKAVLADVELLALDLVTTHFPEQDASTSSPLAEAESEAAQRLLEQTEVLISQHVTQWQSSLEELRSRWSETLDRHQSELETSLSRAVSESLSGCGDALNRQSESQKALAKSLEQVTSSQQQLISIQKEVAEQLEGGQSNDGLDETLHTLSAAVHLLTSRVSQQKAA